jgi:hypothetical protein
VRRKILPLAMLAACTHPGATGPAGAAAGCDQARVATLPFQSAGRVPTIEASIAGQPVRVALSGNDSINELAQSAAQRLNLPARTVQARPASPDGKPAPVTILRIPQLDIGQAHFVNLSAKQLDRKRRFGGPSPDLVLAMTALRDFSFDLDLRHHRFSLYRGSACNSADQPFGTAVVAMNMQPDLRNRAVIPVSLDGNTLTALLDPASPYITVSARAAGLSPPSDAKALHTPDGAVIGHVWVRRFDQLRIGPDLLRDVKLVVVDGPPFSEDMLIGGPYLNHRRVVLSMPDRKVYIEVPGSGS